MRRRPAPDPHAAEVARRRLEALSRELGLEGPGSRAERAGRGFHGAPAVDEDLDAELAAVSWTSRSGGSVDWPPSAPAARVPQPRGSAGRAADASPERWPAEARGAQEGPPRDDGDRVIREHPYADDVRRVAGRHALPRLSWRERWGLWLTERSAAGTRQFGAAHLAIVVLLVAVSLAVGAWHTLRGSVEQAPVVAPTLTAPSGGASGDDTAPDGAVSPSNVPSTTGSAAPASTAPDTGSGAEVVVDVVGRVRRPGIAVLPAGSRVVDALEAAGGARPGVPTDSLNLARPVTDGEQIVVGRPAALAAPPTGASGSVGGAPSAGASPTALVNLNTADQVALETLPGVGPVTAAAILQWRTEHGGFTAVEELLEVSGIGDATLAEIAPHVTI